MIKAILFLLGIVGFAFSQTCTTEEAALTAFYNAAGGANWTNRTNWLTTSDYCSWFGVTCNKPLALGGVVIGIELNNNNLTGTLSDQISCLKSLKTFYINENPGLSWTINGSALCDLSQSLQFFQANNSGLTGTLPTCLCGMNYMQYFYVDRNDITGELPACTAPTVMTYLREMHVRCTGITGTLPAWFNSLNFLEELLLECNNDFTCPAVAPSNIPIFTCGISDNCDILCPITPTSCPDTLNVENCGIFRYVSCVSDVQVPGVDCNIYVPLDSPL